MTDFEKTKVHMGLITAGSIIVSAFGLGVAVTNKLNEVKESVNSVRTEMHTAIDSVKNKQAYRAFQSDLKFQQIEEKLDRLVSKK